VARVRLLIADSNSSIRQLVIDLLQENCDIVSVVADGRAAIEAAEAAKPNIVVLGVSLEDASGFEIARRLRQTTCQPRVILLSLHESRDLVRAAFGVGASGYVFTSRLLDDLPEAVDKVHRGEVFEPVA
jgi:two-component system, NarL family, invasion response regulator UvrY